MTDPVKKDEKPKARAGTEFDVSCPKLSSKPVRVTAKDAEAAEAEFRTLCAGLSTDAELKVAEVE